MDRRHFLLCSLAALEMTQISRSPCYSLAPVSTENREPSDQPPVIPVGLDAYRMWDRWAYQRIGARAYMTSTYDRGGGNEGADASHYLYQLSDVFEYVHEGRTVGVVIGGPTDWSTYYCRTTAILPEYQSR